LCAYSPVNKEPKDRLGVVIKFVPPLAIDAIRRGLTDHLIIFDWEFLDSIRVVTCINFGTIGYGRGNDTEFRKHYCTALLNSTCDEDRRSLVMLLSEGRYRR
jgi:hypothetical protein